MILLGNILVGLVALLHFYFLILEMFFWTKPKGLKVFGNTLEQVRLPPDFGRRDLESSCVG